LAAWLKALGAHVVGISLDPPTTPSHFVAASINSGLTDLRIDILNYMDLAQIFADTQPDFVFHLAAQPLVRLSYEDPIYTWRVNTLGTLHVLESLRAIQKDCSAVIVTSDKCYDNVEWVWGYRETDRVGGPDPYSASKGAAELAVSSYIKSFYPSQTSLVRIASARAGNVIGGGDWAADRIVPDCVRAWSTDNIIELRNPHSTRPWQHVLEPLSGYLTLAASLAQQPCLHGESFNFGPLAQQNHSVLQLVQEMALHWPEISWRDVSNGLPGPYESNLLRLNCDKALHHLKWHAVMSFEDTVKLTADWYLNYYNSSSSAHQITSKQINLYTQKAMQKALFWAC
jgi:CDP-glucose 4,6-dehydratase